MTIETTMGTTVGATTAHQPPAPGSWLRRRVAAIRARRLPLLASAASAVAVLLTGAPVSALMLGRSWLGYAGAAVAVVMVTGLLLHRCGVPIVTAGQCLALLVLLTVVFSDDGVLGVLPGPAAVRELGGLITGAGRQISLETAPVRATPEILLLVTASFGLLAVAVHLAAVSAAAPAAAGVPLLAVYAVPAALADDLLPAWTVVSAAAGFGLLLVTSDGVRARATTGREVLRRLPAAIALVSVAVVLALGLGAGAGFIGTAGRFDGDGGSGGAIGLSPFTALRGQLDQSDPVELLRVRGLERPRYLRALTLRDFVPGRGWQATRPAPGTPLPGPVQPQPAVAGQVVDVQVENVAFKDYWLPLFGEPLAVDGLPDAQWAFDQRSGTAYSIRPRDDGSWTQRALLPAPTDAELRGVVNAKGTAPEYGSLTGVPPEVIALAQQVVAGRTNNFDRAMALQDFFTGPDSRFRYSLATAPSNGGDALVEFLTVGRTGYCEQFASAMAVMLRAVDIPSRVAVGFTAGAAVGDYRSIRTSDAHAWVEAYFPGIGWTTFDPTPLSDGRTVTPEYVLEARGAAGPDATAAGQGDPGSARLEREEPPVAPVPLGDQRAPEAAAPAPGGGDAVPLWPPAVVVLVIVCALVPATIRVLHRRRRFTAVAAGGPEAAAAGWQELLAESADRGVPSPPSDTVRGAGRRLVREHRLGQEAQQALRTVIAAVESSWYGGGHPEPGELTGPIRTIRAGIVAGTALSVRARLLPGSVLRRSRGRHDQADLPDTETAAPGPESESAAVYPSATPVRSGAGSAPPCGR